MFPLLALVLFIVVVAGTVTVEATLVDGSVVEILVCFVDVEVVGFTIIVEVLEIVVLADVVV
jgi:hypothetical protein